MKADFMKNSTSSTSSTELSSISERALVTAVDEDNNGGDTDAVIAEAASTT